MSTRLLITGVATAVALGAAITVYPAIAQPGSVGPANEQIIVEAPGYVFTRKAIDGRKNHLMNAEVASITRTVSYADLQLWMPEGAAMLKQRVNDTAVQICRDLNNRFPRTSFQVVYGKEDCVKSTVDSAMTMVDMVIAASAG